MRRRVQELEWDAIAAVVAVLVALVLNVLQVANTEILVTVALVLVALLLVRDLRREAGDLRTELVLGELNSRPTPRASARSWRRPGSC